MSELPHVERFMRQPTEALPEDVRYPSTSLIEISAQLGFDTRSSVTSQRETLLADTYACTDDLESAIERHFDECDVYLVQMTERPENRCKWSQIVLGYRFYIADTWLQVNHYRACTTVLEWLRDEVSHLDADELKYMAYINDAIETITKEYIHPPASVRHPQVANTIDTELI